LFGTYAFAESQIIHQKRRPLPLFVCIVIKDIGDIGGFGMNEEPNGTRHYQAWSPTGAGSYYK